MTNPTTSAQSTTGSDAPNPAVAGGKNIALTWTVTQQYQRTYTPEQWAEAMEWFDDVTDPTDLDECYNRLERQDWKAEEFLQEEASDRYWCDTEEARVSDLQERPDGT